jgi:DNA-directed RNA polymerase beta subunit
MEGYNLEDAIVISEKVVRDDIYLYSRWWLFIGS